MTRENYSTSAPPDIEARLSLLKKMLAANDASAESIKIHLIWILETRPQLSGREQRRDAVSILTQAARGLVLKEPALAEKCLRLALELDPCDADLKVQLAHFYSLFNAQANLAFNPNAPKILTANLDEEHFYHLTRMPAVAFESGNLDQAVASAKELLTLSESFTNNANHGNAVNSAHTVLGRVALQRGDTIAAIDHLNQSAVDATNPQTNLVESSLELARDLIRAGEKQSVIAYLDQFEAVYGAGSESAFQVRYECEHGAVDRENPRQFEKFLEAFFQHQLKALQSLPREARQNELKRLIDGERVAFDILAAEMEQATKNEEDGNHMDMLERQLFLCKEHVKALEQLQLRD